MENRKDSQEFEKWFWIERKKEEESMRRKGWGWKKMWMWKNGWEIIIEKEIKKFKRKMWEVEIARGFSWYQRT